MLAGPDLNHLEVVKTFENPTVVCDYCNDELPNGTEVIALTMWRPAREPEPENWEAEYFPEGGVEV